MKVDVLQNFSKVELKPYPHICIENSLPINVYKELEQSFPEDLICSTTALDNGKTYRYKSNPVLVEKNVDSIWQEFFTWHTSEEFFHKVIDIFKESICNYYSIETYNNFKNNSIGVRKIDKKTNFVTDCQFVVHEPIEETSTSRTPHLDNPGEIYAGLLYMKKQKDKSVGGNFTLHDIDEVDKVYMQSGREVKQSNPVKEIKYTANTFCMFLNVHNSVHSVTPRNNPTERRHSINIIGEYNKTGKMWEKEEIR